MLYLDSNSINTLYGVIVFFGVVTDLIVLTVLILIKESFLLF